MPTVTPDVQAFVDRINNQTVSVYQAVGLPSRSGEWRCPDLDISSEAQLPQHPVRGVGGFFWGAGLCPP